MCTRTLHIEPNISTRYDITRRTRYDITSIIEIGKYCYHFLSLRAAQFSHQCDSQCPISAHSFAIHSISKGDVNCAARNTAFSDEWAVTVRVTKIKKEQRKKGYVTGFLFLTVKCMYVFMGLYSPLNITDGACLRILEKHAQKYGRFEYSINRKPAANRGIKIQLEISVTCE